MTVTKRLFALLLAVAFIFSTAILYIHAEPGPDEPGEDESSIEAPPEESDPEEESSGEDESSQDEESSGDEKQIVTVTLVSSGNGRVTLSSGHQSGNTLSVEAGAEVTLSVVTDTDNSITSLTVGESAIEDASGKAVFAHRFSAETDTEINLVIDEDTSVGRDIKAGKCKFCTVEFSTNRANVGTEVTVTVIPEIGEVRKLVSVTVNDRRISFSNLTATFTVGEAEECIVEADCMSLYAMIIEDSEHGKISAYPNEDNHSYVAGANVTLTIQPDEGYVLSELIVKFDGMDPVDYLDRVSNNRVTVQTNENGRDTIIRATFVKGVEAKVTIIGEGAIAPNTKYFLPDSEVTFKFAPAVGYIFKSLKINGVETEVSNNSFVCLMDGEKEITVEFEKAVQLIPNISVGGKVYANDTELLGSIYVKPGEDVVIKCVPSMNYNFSALYIDGEQVRVDENLTYTLRSVNSDTRVTVRFNVNDNVTSYTVNATAGEGGSVTPDGESKVVAGDTLVFTFTPDEGYVVDTVVLNGVAVKPTNNTYTVAAVVGNITLTVTFRESNGEFPENVVTVDDIDWTKSSITIYMEGKDQIAKEVFDKIANEYSDKEVAIFFGKFFLVVPAGGITPVDTPTIELTASLNDKSLESYKAISDYITSRVESIEYNIMNIVSTYSFPAGTTLSVQVGMQYAIKTLNYLIYDGTSLVSPSSGSNKVTVTKDGFVTVPYLNDRNFVLCEQLDDTYSIISTSSTGGYINPAGTKKVGTGENASYTVTSNDGYVINMLLVDGKEVVAASGQKTFVYTFERVSAEHTISVTFERANNVGPNENDANSGLLVSIIVVIVSIIAAGILLLIRWKQETY